AIHARPFWKPLGTSLERSWSHQQRNCQHLLSTPAKSSRFRDDRVELTRWSLASRTIFRHDRLDAIYRSLEHCGRGAIRLSSWHLFRAEKILSVTAPRMIERGAQPVCTKTCALNH